AVGGSDRSCRRVRRPAPGGTSALPSRSGRNAAPPSKGKVCQELPSVVMSPARSLQYCNVAASAGVQRTLSMELHQANTRVLADGSSVETARQIMAGRAPRARRRPDPLGTVWTAEILPMLEATPSIRPVAIFEKIRQNHPEIPQGVRRTLERRIRNWRGTSGPIPHFVVRPENRPSYNLEVAFLLTPVVS